jgi:ABC-type Fe3+-hydroxamate transport system substrate-binding protein
MSLLVDALGKKHPPVDPGKAVRIVSLVPSITELLCDLGLASRVVGRTGFCIHPQSAVSAIPKVGGTKDVNFEKIRRLAPTHLIVNIDENEKPTVEALADVVPNVIVTHPMAPRDNLELYRLLGGIFRKEREANVLCERFEREYDALALAMSSPSRFSFSTNRVLYCIWQDPWMTVSRDTYIARMLELIGWQQWLADTGVRYPEFTWDAKMLSVIDEILLSSEPYTFTQKHVDALERQTGKPVRLVNGEMLSWYGSRAIQGLRYLRELAGG